MAISQRLMNRGLRTRSRVERHGRQFGPVVAAAIACIAQASAFATVQSPPKLPGAVHGALGMEFVLIPAGSFIMGSSDESVETQWRALSAMTKTPNRTLVTAQSPAHRVTISRAFYFAKFEVTRGQWRTIMGNDPSPIPDCGDDCPVSNVSWNDAQTFIARLNELHDGHRYRLPTEAEWEYGAKAGAQSLPSPTALDAVAWYGINANGRPHPVGTKQPNSWGLYDMIGNAWELVQDLYDTSYYRTSPSVDPQGPAVGNGRGERGGGFMEGPLFQSSVWRGPGKPPDTAAFDIGFRVLMEVAR